MATDSPKTEVEEAAKKKMDTNLKKFPGQRGKGEIKQHTEIIIDPFRGEDKDHDKFKATTRKAAFRTYPAAYSWLKTTLADELDKEITITVVMGQLVLSVPMKKGFFKTAEPIEAVDELSANLAQMVKQILCGAAGESPEKQSRIVAPTAAERDKLKI